VSLAVEIFVALIGEGVDVWRPVQAESLGGRLYRIATVNPDPQAERWQFVRGDVVRCEPREFSGGTRGLVAMEKVPGCAGVGGSGVRWWRRDVRRVRRAGQPRQVS